MSRFGLGLMGDFEDDPFFGSHMRHMNQMMNSMFADPFGLMGPPALTNNHHQQARMNTMPAMQMMPFGFPMMPSLPMGRMFTGLENMGQDPNCHSYTSSSIMTMTSGPDGRPQVYQETMSTTSAPGGVKETKKTVSDSLTGQRSLAIGHHIGDRAHILEREQNLHSGEREERQEYINLEEEEAEAFNHEWQTRTKRSAGAIAGSSHRSRNPYNRSQQENRPLALPSTVPPSRQCKSQSRPLATARRGLRPAQSSRASNTKSSSRSAENNCSTSTSTSTDSKTISTSPSTLVASPNRANSQPEDSGSTTTWAATSPATSRNSTSRKREHSPEPNTSPSNKRLSSQSQSPSSAKDPIPCIDVTD